MMILYSNNIISVAKNESKMVPNLIANFIQHSTEDNFDEILVQYILEEVIQKVDYPLIVTDADNRPLYWKNLDIPENVELSALTKEEKARLYYELKKMRKKHWVIPLRYTKRNSKILGYTYFSESASIRLLKFLPYLVGISFLLFILLGIYGLILKKRQEKNQLWIGLAKETAHQFGTPITSLIGWIDILKLKINSAEIDEKENFDMMLNQMAIDIEQLKKVASRFGKVGSTIKLVDTDIVKVLDETVKYYKLRTPTLTNKINLYFITKMKEKIIKIDEELFKWAIENLIKNAIDAMQLKGGNIIVTLLQDEENIDILVKDEGKGMPKKMFNSVFNPGITTKKRGWGLGLSLSKRIIEEYHNGKIKVLESTIGEGTTFEIEIPENL